MLAGIWLLSPPYSHQSWVPQTHVPTHGHTAACCALGRKSSVWLYPQWPSPAPVVRDREDSGPQCSGYLGYLATPTLPPLSPGADAFSGQINHRRKCGLVTRGLSDEATGQELHVPGTSPGTVGMGTSGCLGKILSAGRVPASNHDRSLGILIQEWGKVQPNPLLFPRGTCSLLLTHAAGTASREGTPSSEH